MYCAIIFSTYQHPFTMSNENEQIKRIRQMEKRFNYASSVVKRLSAEFEKLEEAQELIDVLNDYYESELWRHDFEDDEAGLLPKGLKRGVLSEDGIWNLLSDYQELKTRIQGFVGTNKNE